MSAMKMPTSCINASLPQSTPYHFTGVPINFLMQVANLFLFLFMLGKSSIFSSKRYNHSNGIVYLPFMQGKRMRSLGICINNQIQLIAHPRFPLNFFNKVP